MSYKKTCLGEKIDVYKVIICIYPVIYFFNGILGRVNPRHSNKIHAHAHTHLFSNSLISKHRILTYYSSHEGDFLKVSFCFSEGVCCLEFSNYLNSLIL